MPNGDEDWMMGQTPMGAPFLQGTDPAGNPFGTSVAPEIAEDPEKMRQLLARLERNFQTYPSAAAQQPSGGGQYQLPEGFGESIQGAFQSMPMREAERAVSAAIQFQGMRGYQQSLQAGESAETALARWAPLMFYSHPAAVSTTMRSMRAPAMTPYQEGTLNRQQGALDLARQRFELEKQKQEAQSGLSKQRLDILAQRTQEAAATRSQSQRNYLLRREAAAAEKALANARAQQADPNLDKASKPGDEAMRQLEASYASAARALTNAPATAAPTAPQAAPAAAPAPPKPANEVIRRTKDGRLAVFDSDTKKFLRYAD